jgi:GH24 family phage-related lysozyme (muramidase)
MMEVDYDVALEIASHEAVIRQAYKDSVGVWTWSVGLTSATGHDVKRYIGEPQTMEHCLAVYAWALNNYADAVRAEFSGHDLTKAQFAGALSFHWNTGAIRSASWPDLWKAGKIAAARTSFLSWKKPKEIIARRQKEAALFFDGKWSNDGTILEYTRLTASGTPVWGSAKRINVEREMRAAFGLADTPAEPVPVGPVRPDIAAHLTSIETATAAIRAALEA